MNNNTNLDQAIEQLRSATSEFINGRTDAWKANSSHQPDATLFGAWGGYERGWEQLSPRYEWAAARFAGGDVEFEEIARYASSDLACLIQFEHMRVRVTDIESMVPVDLRVTLILRREDDGWKLVNRHADALIAIQAPDVVINQ